MAKNYTIKHRFLREKLPPSIAQNRSLHTFIIVLGENEKTGSEKMMALQKRLDDVISKKIIGKDCKEKKNKFHVKPETCQNKKIIKEKNEKQKKNTYLPIYFICTVQMNELNVVELYLLNFNPMKDTDTCEYSKNGSIKLGVREREHYEENNQRFNVNHLASSKLTDIIMNCNKK